MEINLLYVTTTLAKEEIKSLLQDHEIIDIIEVTQKIDDKILYVSNANNLGKLLNITFFGGYKVVNKGVYSEIHGNSVDLSFFYHFLNDYMHFTCATKLYDLPIIKFSNLSSVITESVLKNTILKEVCPDVAIECVKLIEEGEIHVLIDSLENCNQVITSTNGGQIDNRTIKSEVLNPAPESIPSSSTRQAGNPACIVSNLPPDMSPEAVADYLGIPQNSVTVESLSTYPEFWCYVDENQTEAIIKKLQCAPVFDHFKPYAFATPSKNARKTNRKKKVKTLLSNNSLTITGFPKGICFTDIAEVLTPFGNIKLLQFALIDNEMQLRVAFMKKQSAEKAYHQLTEYKGTPLTVKYFTRTGKTVSTESTSNLQVTPSQTSNRPLQETPLVQVTPILFTPPENETQKSTPFFESPAF